MSDHATPHAQYLNLSTAEPDKPCKIRTDGVTDAPRGAAIGNVRYDSKMPISDRDQARLDAEYVAKFGHEPRDEKQARDLMIRRNAERSGAPQRTDSEEPDANKARERMCERNREAWKR